MKLTPKHMLRLILIFFIFLTFNTLSSKNKKKPNFLFVLVDDQPHDAVGFSNRYPFLKTPNIDKLAKEGVNFKNFLSLNQYVPLHVQVF